LNAASAGSIGSGSMNGRAYRALFALTLAAFIFGRISIAVAEDASVAPTPLPPVANDDPWFGAVQAISNPQAAGDAGVKWTRLIFPWNEIQPNGPNDWEQGYFSDDDIDSLRSRGIEIEGIALYTPTWAARDPQYDTRSVPRDLSLPPDDPRNPWGSFMRRLASQYAGRIDTWVIYNEPDVYAEPNDFRTFAGSPADYAALLKTAYLAAKSVNPGARIVMAGLTYWWDKEEGRSQYFQRVLDALASDPSAAGNAWYFDVVDAHCYGNPLNSFAVPMTYRRIMQARGISKPIWIDESNVLIKNDPRVQNGEGPFRATLDEQASYVIESVALARAAGVERYAIYKLQDEAPENGDEYWGLTRNDGTARPSYVAYQVAARYLADVTAATYEWQGSHDPPTDDEITRLLASNANRVQWPWPAAVNWVTMQRGAQRITVIWNASPTPVQATIRAHADSAQLVDKRGNVRAVFPRGGAYSLALEPSRNNSDPRDPSLYLVGGSPWIVIENRATE